jgi:hypothetical protein
MIFKKRKKKKGIYYDEIILCMISEMKYFVLSMDTKHDIDLIREKKITQRSDNDVIIFML